MIHVAPEGIEQSAPERATSGLPRKPRQHHRQVQHNHLEASFDAIRNAEFLIKFRPAGLRHDGAIERVNGSGLELAAKQRYHGSSMRAGRAARRVVFGAAAG
jgi:hypothetical protein